jgi:hypothetical protein
MLDYVWVIHALAQLAQRPAVSAETIVGFAGFADFSGVSLGDLDSALADCCALVIDGQTATIKRVYQHDGLRIPANLVFGCIDGLSHEMVDVWSALAHRLLARRAGSRPHTGSFVSVVGLREHAR